MGTREEQEAGYLELEWVYGYRGHQCRANLHQTPQGALVYFVAAVGVVHDPAANRQRFYRGHSDDILCLTLSSDGETVASGQIGDEALVCLWSPTTLETKALLNSFSHKAGVASLSFSHDAKLLLTVGLDPESTLSAWDVGKARALAHAPTATQKVFDVRFEAGSSSHLATAGLKHLSFWRLSGNSLTGQPQTELPAQTFLSLCAANGSVYTGSLSGSLSSWREGRLHGTVDKAHSGGVFALETSPSGGFATGGKDGRVRLWDEAFRPLSTFDLRTLPNGVGYADLWVRALSLSGDTIAIGTHWSEIILLPAKGGGGSARQLVNGHGEGELWALATHPKEALFATGGDDKTLRLWDAGAKGPPLCLRSLKDWVRSLAFSPDGSCLAAGLSSGEVQTYRLTKEEGGRRGLTEGKTWRQRRRPIHELKFSPDGGVLAVGSNDGLVDLYAVRERFKRLGTSPSLGSHVVHLDWARDTKRLRVNTGAGDQVLLDVASCKLLPRDQAEAPEPVNAWATETCVLARSASGVWPRGAVARERAGDVNAVHGHPERAIVAAGDDFGRVSLARLSLGKDRGDAAKAKRFGGHSEHVTCVRWLGGERLVSIGGADHAVFQWRLVDRPTEGLLPDEHEEEPDEGGALDSDVESEARGKAYARLVPKEAASRALRASIRQELKQDGKRRSAPPKASLELRHVFGYRGYDCHNNVFFTQDGAVVYHLAAVGIVLEPSSGKQRHYVKHTDDILALTLHPLNDLVATGQMGKKPKILVWDAGTLETVSTLSGATHTAGVVALDFSADGRRLLSVGLDSHHTVAVWDWRKGLVLASARGHKDRIFSARFCPSDPLKLVSVGVKHIKFWTTAGAGLTHKRGVFGSVGKMDTMLCVEWGRSAGESFSGCANGSVYRWQDSTLKAVIKDAHTGPVFALFPLDSGFVTGGKDGRICLWDESFGARVQSYSVAKARVSEGRLLSDHPPIRAVALGGGVIAAGTKHGQLLSLSQAGDIRVLAQGHCEGEVWGLATSGSGRAATVSDDGVLRLWSVARGEEGLVAAVVLRKPARSVALGEGRLAIGFKDGSVQIRDTAQTDQVLHTIHHRQEEISDVKFSPDGKLLAVASHDNFLDIYDASSGKRVGIGRGASSYLSHCDWEASGKLVGTNSGAKESLFFEAPRGSRQSLDPLTADTDVQWHSYTGVLGPRIQGIWPPGADVTDVNAVDRHPGGQLLLAGDDLGFLRLFPFPCPAKYAKSKAYLGHSAHVTNVRWAGASAALSVGGADTALCVWDLRDSDALGGPSDTSDTDSEEEAGYDSDVEAEKAIDYASKMYSAPLRERRAETPAQANSSEAKSAKPLVARTLDQPVPVLRTDFAHLAKEPGAPKPNQSVQGLRLHHVFGYRGFDCGDNVRYVGTPQGPAIVFHAAGAGIVQDLATGKQRFYLGHDDDVLSLAVWESGGGREAVVATAQIHPTSPSVHVWSAGEPERECLARLRMPHEKGLGCLDFTRKGRQLLTAGMDAEHTLCVWRWSEGLLLAKGIGGDAKICCASWRPDSDKAFVTVGIKHVKFWRVVGDSLEERKGVSSRPVPTMLSLAFAPDDVALTGSVTGDVWLWKAEKLLRVVDKAHGGPVFAMHTCLEDGAILTGAKERAEGGTCVRLWDPGMKDSRPFPLPHSKATLSASGKTIVRSLDRRDGRILVGTKSCDIVQLKEDGEAEDAKFLVQAHGAGELWGLSAHPKSHRVATASYDRTLRIWDLLKKRMTVAVSLEVGGVCCGWSPDGGSVAVGLANGTVAVYGTRPALQLRASRRDRSSPVHALKFAPSGQLIVAGYAEAAVDIYATKDGGQLERSAYVKRLAGPVLSLDFAQDSDLVKVTTSAYKTEYIRLPEGKILKDDEEKDSITFASWTDVVSPAVHGIWSPDSQAGEVNCVDLAHGSGVVGSGDDAGLVKLFRFPCPEAKGAEAAEFVGHSAHVTNVAFSHDDAFLVSTGGDDSCVFVWETTTSE